MIKDKDDKDVIIIEIEKKNKIKEDKEKSNQICYICQEKPVNQISPGGCKHIFCREHLKVNYIY